MTFAHFVRFGLFLLASVTPLLACGGSSVDPVVPPDELDDGLRFVTSSLANGQLGQPYSATLRASGGTGTYSWEISSSRLPDGLRLVDSLITGIPSRAANFGFVVRLEDGVRFLERSMTLEVLPRSGETGRPAGGDRLSVSEGGGCALDAEGRAFCWGQESNGELGNGGETSEQPSGAVWVAGDLRFKNVTANGSTACGVTTSNDAYCWGSGVFGQRGDGTTDRYMAEPTLVLGDLKWSHLELSEGGTCGITLSSELYCWGTRDTLEGAFSRRSQPTPVHPSIGFIDVDRAQNGMCAIRSDRVTDCHGPFPGGGESDQTFASIVTPFEAIDGVVSSSFSVHCAIDGVDLYCWGSNQTGAVGNGSTSPVLAPVQVRPDLEWLTVSTSSVNTCGVTTAGRGYCWGEGDYGALGNGSTDDALEPVEVAGGHQWADIWVGLRTVCGLTSDSDVYCWGSNQNGAVGDGSYGGFSSAPTKVVFSN